jgi:hypothetical protein
MHPVDLDGCSILIVDRELAVRGLRILAVGIGEFDGTRFYILQEDGCRYELPEATWDVVERPLTGDWKRNYPGLDWYLVLPPPLQERNAETEAAPNVGPTTQIDNAGSEL